MLSELLPRARCVPLLRMSTNTKQVKQVHAQMITSSLIRQSEAVVHLMEAYFSVRDGEDYACFVFCNSEEATKNSLAWSSMIRNSSSRRRSWQLYAQQITGRVTPEKVSTLCVLRDCELREGVQVHARVVKTGLLSDISVQTTGIHFYGRCREIESARRIFDEMRERSCVTWNAMMSAYCMNECAKEAMELFSKMRGEGTKRTDRTVLPLLSACAQLGKLSVACAAHAFVCKAIEAYHVDLFIGSGLVDMYCKCGCLESAGKVFDGMRERNVLTWSAMAAGLAMHGKGQEALEMLEAMQQEGILPNAVTFTCLLSACCHTGMVEEGLLLFHSMTVKFGVEPRVQHYSCVVDLLGRAGMVDEACEVVESMPMEPDAVVWRALLSACKMHGRIQLAAGVAKKLLQVEQAAPSQTSPIDGCQDFVALSNVYALAERWDDVLALRKEMKSIGVQNKPGTCSVQVHTLDFR